MAFFIFAWFLEWKNSLATLLACCITGSFFFFFFGPVVALLFPSFQPHKFHSVGTLSNVIKYRACIVNSTSIFSRIPRRYIFLDYFFIFHFTLYLFTFFFKSYLFISIPFFLFLYHYSYFVYLLFILLDNLENNVIDLIDLLWEFMLCSIIYCAKKDLFNFMHFSLRLWCISFFFLLKYVT